VASAEKSSGDGDHPRNDTESGQHIGRSFQKRGRITDAIRTFRQTPEDVLGNVRVRDHGQDDADYESRDAQQCLGKRVRDCNGYNCEQAPRSTKSEQHTKCCRHSAVMDVFTALMCVLVVPLLRLFGNHVNMEVLVRMVMMNVQMLVNLDLAAEKTNDGGESYNDEQASSSKLEGIFPVLGKQHASEVSGNSGDRDHQGMSSGKPHGKPDDSPEIMFHGNAECGYGGEMIRTNSVQQSSGEDGEKQKHRI
jgi:hypothetical protein